MGFLSALPPIWRLLQCIRRYYDTKSIFPHLFNTAKYATTIMATVTLSMYRIHRSDTYFALFIIFSLLNSVYACKSPIQTGENSPANTSVALWDVLMDFSLLKRQS